MRRAPISHLPPRQHSAEYCGFIKPVITRTFRRVPGQQ